MFILTFMNISCSTNNKEITNTEKLSLFFSKDTLIAGDSVDFYFDPKYTKKFMNDSILIVWFGFWCSDYTRQFQATLKKPDNSSLLKIKVQIPRTAYYAKAVVSSNQDKYCSESTYNMIYGHDSSKQIIPQKYSIAKHADAPNIIRTREDIQKILDLNFKYYQNDFSIYFPLLKIIKINKDTILYRTISTDLKNNIEYFESYDVPLEDKITYNLLMSYHYILDKNFNKSNDFLARVLSLLRNNPNINIHANIITELDYLLETFQSGPGRLMPKYFGHDKVLENTLYLALELDKPELLISLARYLTVGDKNIQPLFSHLNLRTANMLMKEQFKPEVKFNSNLDVYPLLLKNLMKLNNLKKTEEFFNFATKILIQKEIHFPINTIHYYYSSNQYYLPEIYFNMGDYYNENCETDKFINCIKNSLQISNNKIEVYPNIRSATLKLFDYYLQRDSIDLARFYLKQAFSYELLKNKNDEKLLNSLNLKRKKQNLSEFTYEDFAKSTVDDFINKSESLTKENTETLNQVFSFNNLADSLFILVNINDECPSCNIGIRELIDKAGSNKFKIIVISNINNYEIKKTFGKNIIHLQRDKKLIDLLNINHESDIMGLLIYRQKKILLYPMLFDIDFLKGIKMGLCRSL